MRIIPAIDLIDGKCVRLRQGDYMQKTVYHKDPLEVAKAFEDAGLHYLHLVDLDGAKAGTVLQAHILERLARQTGLQIDFGGGVKATADLERVFDAGARQVTIGSTAVQDPELFFSWLNTFGADKLILGADARKGRIATHGWQKTTDLDVLDIIENYNHRGVRSVICTDIATDGMLAGPALPLYREIRKRCPKLELIASGGVSRMQDVLALQETGVAGVIIGKAIYEEQIILSELSALC